MVFSRHNEFTEANTSPVVDRNSSTHMRVHLKQWDSLVETSTYEKHEEQDCDDPIGENHIENNADANTEHQHGLENQGKIIVEDRGLEPEVVPYRCERGSHNHAYACNDTKSIITNLFMITFDPLIIPCSIKPKHYDYIHNQNYTKYNDANHDALMVETWISLLCVVRQSAS